MKKLIAGNWKMNGDNASNASLLDAILNGLTGLDGCDILVCPPSLYVATVAQRLNGTPIAVGAQDVSIQEKGAFTGENSAGMLRDVGASYVLVGHSERRQYHHETDNLVGEKAQAALAKGVTPIVCIGETLAEREAGETNAVVKRQLAAAVHAVGHCVSEIVVAYEPVWAIGTGKNGNARASAGGPRRHSRAAGSGNAKRYAHQDFVWGQHECRQRRPVTGSARY